MNKAQKQLYDGYRDIDIEAQVLGHHRGRPVILTHTSRDHWRPPRPKRHVVVLGVGGMPVDLGPNWEDHFEFDGTASAPTVRSVIEDWLSWSVRS